MSSTTNLADKRIYIYILFKTLHLFVITTTITPNNKHSDLEHELNMEYNDCSNARWCTSLMEKHITATNSIEFVLIELIKFGLVFASHIRRNGN